MTKLTSDVGPSLSLTPPRLRSRRSTACALVAAFALGVSLLAAAPASAADNCSVRRTATTSTSTCAKSADLNSQQFVSIWRDSVSNSTPKPITATCRATTRGTVSFTFTLSGSATVKAWVFADVAGKVSGGMKTSISTGIDVSSTFSVPAFRTTNCDRGIVRQNFTSRISETTTQQGRPIKTVNKTYTGFGPVRAQWQIKQL